MTHTRTALIVGAGSGLCASLARLFANNGMKVALAARATEQARSARGGDRRAGVRLRCVAARPTSRSCSPRSRPRSARRTSSSTTRASARAAPSPISIAGRRREGDRGLGVRRLSGRAAGGAAHAAEGRGRDPVHRRVGEREGLCAVGAVRDGQVRAARPRAVARARACAARHSRRAFRHRRRHPQRAPAAAMPTSRTRCSIRTRSRQSYLHVLQQPRSAWTWEIELRPWVENF